jgi:DTW domain-containing protein YfiP
VVPPGAGVACAPGRRHACAVCLRPHSTCLCQWVRPVLASTEVLILQSPLEQHNAKGTARLLHLCLPGSLLLVGECFEPALLASLLHAPLSSLQSWPSPPSFSPAWPSPPIAVADRAAGTGADGRSNDGDAIYPVLLYPDTAHDPGLHLASAPPLAGDLAQRRVRLIVLDGTWRKSRKMLYQNRLLQHLPRLGLRDVPASRYLIRKAQASGQLSTLEATCAALMQLEADAAPYQAVLAGFDGFVAQQLAQRASGKRAPGVSL